MEVVVEDIRREVDQFSICNFLCICRSANVIAHNLTTSDCKVLIFVFVKLDFLIGYWILSGTIIVFFDGLFYQ